MDSESGGFIIPTKSMSKINEQLCKTVSLVHVNSNQNMEILKVPWFRIRICQRA